LLGKTQNKNIGGLKKYEKSAHIDVSIMCKTAIDNIFHKTTKNTYTKTYLNRKPLLHEKLYAEINDN